jgi:GNAT superfamily N-acetyltransferase
MISVRIGTLKDLEKVQQLNQQLFSYETENKLHDAYNPDWPFSKDGEIYFKKRLAVENGGIVFIAEDEGEIVGYLAAKYADYSFRSENPIAEIENIFVEDAYRRKNVGTLLFEQFKNWCVENSIKRAKVTAAYPNRSAREFYESLGFSSSAVTLERKMLED